MIDVLPGSHSAIFNTPRRRIPPSLIWGILAAVGVHGLLAFYFITQGFHPIAVPDEPKPVISGTYVVEIQKPVKPVEKPKPLAPVIKAHTPVEVPLTIDTVPIIPVKGPDVITEGLPVLPDTTDTAPPDASGTQTGPAYVDATWTRFPDAETLSSYYPAAALEDNVTGTATVECTVLDTAGRVSCTVLSETPKRAGFGKATAAMISAVGRVDTSKGNVRPGSVLRKTVTWTLSD